jgi:hypothetical protein
MPQQLQQLCQLQKEPLDSILETLPRCWRAGSCSHNNRTTHFVDRSAILHQETWLSCWWWRATCPCLLFNLYVPGLISQVGLLPQTHAIRRLNCTTVKYTLWAKGGDQAECSRW